MNNNTRIPAPFSFHTESGNSPTRSKKRYKMSTTTTTTSHINGHGSLLNDITNRTPSAIGGLKMSFGDQSAVELVKSRQRKIFKDIAHFKNAIIEIEKEIDNLNKVLIPDVIKLDNQRRNDIVLVNDEILQLNNEVNETKLSLESLYRNDELENNNLQLAHSIKVTTFENELEDQKYKYIVEREKDLFETENMKPNEQWEIEMIALKEQFEQVTRELNDITESNNQICKEYEKSGPVVIEFENFKQKKTQEMNDLLIQHQSLKDKHIELEKDVNENELKRNNLSQELNQMNQQIIDCEKSIEITTNLNLKHSKELTAKEKEYQILSKELQQITDKFKISSDKDLLQSGKLIREQKLRKKLSLSIAQINHKIPIVTFTDVASSSHEHPLSNTTINFKNNPLITNISDLIQYEIQPLYDFYEPKYRNSLTIFYVSESSTTKFVPKFIDFLQGNYSISATKMETDTNNQFKSIDIEDINKITEHSSSMFKFELSITDQFFQEITLVPVQSISEIEGLTKSLIREKDNHNEIKGTLPYNEMIRKGKSIFICNTNNTSGEEIRRLCKYLQYMTIK
ncbi:similar to Saccharomyces cerevisiae YPL253C VIK1 Protein that forms a complex with Kar3p at the spindle pole body [Maudiozyma saulgeensis]|uniref:Similar to Saccharomyces cerevisiae YPL253C VIK1 Protein that forms a complex with Kar3p at the spindle pole body n=1 Tax=Maudiozyma saulgeensis TaxID=1789683 RepID=A0A1X7QZF3_9SACH|nr:similar to Saccharomyces cerevisiae YPL253C VIK1 Protein that forms a complex with Kar3p at the spindle pole body [Kazachstania saulgeensis]